MAKENFFTRIFSFFKGKPKEDFKEATLTSEEKEQLLKKIAALETDITTYKREIKQLEEQLSLIGKGKISDSELGDKYLALKKEFSEKEKEIELLRKEISNLESKIETIGEKGTNDNKSFTNQITEKDQQIKKITKEYEAIKSSLLDELQKLKEEAIQQKSIYDEQERKITLFQEQNKELEKDLEEEKGKRRDQKKEHREEIEKKDKEISEKDIKILEKEKKEKQLLTSNRELEEKNEDLTKELSLKKQTIEFVQNILNAHNTTNESYQKKYDQTFRICNYVKTTVADLFEEVLKLKFHDSFISKIDQWQNIELKSWIKDKRVIAIVGEFSSGKTSLVNKILNPNNDPNVPKLLENSAETTAIPSYITYTPQKGGFETSFIAPNKQQKDFPKKNFLMTNKEIIDQVNVLSLMDCFVIMANIESLRGITLLDTPGFASNNNELMQKTVNAIKEASAVFWIIDAENGTINNSSIRVIRENLRNLPLYVIVNKCDRKSAADLEATERVIKQTMDREKIQVQGYLRFSNRDNSYLENLKRTIQSTEIKENDTHFIDKILAKLQEKHVEWIKKIEEKEGRNTAIYREIQNLNSQKGNIRRSIEANIDGAIDTSNKFGELFEYKSKIFVSDFYKLPLDKFETFNNYLNRIRNVITNFRSQYEGYGGKESAIIRKKAEMEEIDKEIQELEKQEKLIKAVLNQFEKLLKEYGYKIKK